MAGTTGSVVNTIGGADVTILPPSSCNSSVDAFSLPSEPTREGYTYLYALTDPQTQLVRYFGKTNDPVKRLWTHRFGPDVRKKTKKNSWIKSLARQGLAPIMEIIAEVPVKDWQQYERLGIAMLRAMGLDLTNGTDGGDGGLIPWLKGAKRPPEVVRKISLANKGKTISRETKEKIRHKLTGYKHPPEVIARWRPIRKAMWERMSEETKASRTAKIVAKISRPVAQYSWRGEFIALHKSGMEAERAAGASHKHITSVCHGKRKHCGGFIWRLVSGQIRMWVDPLPRDPHARSVRWHREHRTAA